MLRFKYIFTSNSQQDVITLYEYVRMNVYMNSFFFSENRLFKLFVLLLFQILNLKELQFYIICKNILSSLRSFRMFFNLV